MTLTASSPDGYARLTEYTFTTSLTGSKIIDYGDGHTELFDDFTTTHIYDNVGIYTAHVRETCSPYPERVNSTVISSLPVVNNEIEIHESPISGYSSEDDGLKFGVSLSSSCEPPYYVGLFVDGTISQRVDSTADVGNCEPKHFFYSNLPIEDDTVTIENTTPITVNGEVFGYQGKFCFGYVDDYFGEFDITAKLDVNCDLYSESNDVDFYNCMSVLEAYGEDTNLTSTLTSLPDWVWDGGCFSYHEDSTALEYGANVLSGTVSWEGDYTARDKVNVSSPDEAITYLSGDNRVVVFKYENKFIPESPTDYTITVVLQPCECCDANPTEENQEFVDVYRVDWMGGRLDDTIVVEYPESSGDFYYANAVDGFPAVGGGGQPTDPWNVTCPQKPLRRISTRNATHDFFDGDKLTVRVPKGDPPPSPITNGKILNYTGPTEGDPTNIDWVLDATEVL